jgi:DNA repair exonuclease SbcCD ATPase subunit
MILSRLYKGVFLLSFITLFFACNTDELENKIAELEAEKIEANNALDGKEEIIVDFIGSMNEIEENLAKIKERENIITARFDKGNVEMNNSMKNQIMEDIDLINQLLLDNKDKMAALNAKFHKSEKESNLKIQELETMIKSLANRMKEKDAEISGLHEKLAEANKQLMVLFEEYNNRIEELGDKEDKLNTAYYCYGTAKELKEKGIITKSGGFIGIWKSAKLLDDFNKEYFTKIDISLINEIDLMSKKVKVVTNHPTNSYKVEGEDGSAEKLIILDSEAFWSSSKYLVMVVDQ